MIWGERQKLTTSSNCTPRVEHTLQHLRLISLWVCIDCWSLQVQRSMSNACSWRETHKGQWSCGGRTNTFHKYMYIGTWAPAIYQSTFKGDDHFFSIVTHICEITNRPCPVELDNSSEEAQHPEQRRSNKCWPEYHCFRVACVRLRRGVREKENSFACLD